ncbi:sulfite exporter TauE/SafE family protein [Sulfitobacter albidus]|uniref:Probable membrane transporter protein n=1 Tax=Sulfitobacter albidus TaxID=2829501 RepID=A0A975JCD0_9RHOB|nr:sulfite exporter TauE/SafE family protein [Sulfitobacter albidus]QUJ75747.1 sulfite exporter TauE/SafE family protein [Sulfitobacter albidus]
MESFFPLFSLAQLGFAVTVAVVAGVVKGVVGFAMPLVLLSGLTIFATPETALAGLILPTLVTNGQQALRQGPRAALASTARFWVFLLCGGAALIITAQLVRSIPATTMMAVIGVLVTLLTVLQLSGWRPRLPQRSVPVEATVGTVAGAMGGVSGVWGPPTVLYLTAIGTAKHDQMRVQGVIYGLGAVALLGAHIASGVLRAETVWFSALLVLPAMAGLWLGGQVLDRINQAVFRQLTLLVLLLAGLNLVRRGFFG